LKDNQFHIIIREGIAVAVPYIFQGGSSMNINVQAVKFSMDEDQKEFVDKKLERIRFAEDLITDVLLNIKYDKKFSYECTVNFRWGDVAHVSTEDFSFEPGLNKMVDVLDQKIKKEKDKIQEKK
jgi:putative sigma-54 modulation protein